MNTDLSTSRTQRGAVLIVALVMLLLLSIIGVSSMRGTSLQENMANNLRESNISYQAAEAALKLGARQAQEMFNKGQLDGRDLGSEVAKGTYPNFPDVAQAPAYSIVMLYEHPRIREIGDETVSGVLVRIDATGNGITRDANGQPIAQTQLRSTYFIQ